MFRTEALLMTAALLLCACASKPAYPEAPIQEDEVRIDASALKGSSPMFYSFRDGEKRVDFFVLKVKGGVEAYLDSCARCSAKRKGFRVSGGKLVCNACGVSYPLEDLKGVGSCYPIPVEGSTKDGYFIIKAGELIRAGKYF
jgi:uncharacterized membrane protein